MPARAKPADTLRGETLWFGHIAEYTIHVPSFLSTPIAGQARVHSAAPEPSCEGWRQPPGRYILQGYGAGRTSVEYQPAGCTLPSLAATKSAFDGIHIRFIGDSTAGRQSAAIRAWFPRANITTHVISVPEHSAPLTKLAASWAENTDIVIIAIGLHTTCYRSLETDVVLLRQDLKTFFDKFPPRATILRSTTATSNLGHLDFDAEKCVYYTAPRNRHWNANLKIIAEYYDAQFWDVYGVGAAVVPGKLGTNIYAPEADGTHWCNNAHTELHNNSYVAASGWPQNFSSSAVCVAIVRSLTAGLSEWKN